MKPILNPYLLFNGQAKEAMEFYHSVMGGDLKMQTFAESGMPAKDEEKDLIIHASLEKDGILIMASDGGAEHPVTMGNNVSLSLQGSDEALLTEWFNKLSEGGKVKMPLAKQFWAIPMDNSLTNLASIGW